MSAVIGVDPGHNGGAVLLSGGDVRAWRWSDRRDRKRAPGYDLRDQTGEEQRGLSLYEIGRALALAAGAPGYRLGVEGLFAGRNGAASIELAEATGRLLAGVEPGAAAVLRPPWTTWARAIVRGSATTAALNAARPAWLAGRGIALGALADDDHVLDAACIAGWTLIAGQHEDLIGRTP
jgi:hypothetical protein